MHLLYRGWGSSLRVTNAIQRALLFQVIDLLVLYILHSTNANQSRRGAERVLKAKVKTGMIQEALLQRTYKDYAQVTPAYDYSGRALLFLQYTLVDLFCYLIKN